MISRDAVLQAVNSKGIYIQVEFRYEVLYGVYCMLFLWHGIRAYTRNNLSFIGQHLIGAAASIALLIYWA